jgi:all-trans-retinol 13,14-reductase
MNFYDNNPETTGEMLERFFPGRDDVNRLLMEPIAYANGSTLDDPAITYGIVFSNFMGSGVYTFRGGSDLLVEKMIAELKRNGVECARRSSVEKILVEERDGRKVGRGIVASKRPRGARQGRALEREHQEHDLPARRGGEPPGGLHRARRRPCASTPAPARSTSASARARRIPHIGDLVFTSENAEVQQRRTHRFPHDEPHVFRLLPRHAPGLGPLHGGGVA